MSAPSTSRYQLSDPILASVASTAAEQNRLIEAKRSLNAQAKALHDEARSVDLELAAAQQRFHLGDADAGPEIDALAERKRSIEARMEGAGPAGRQISLKAERLQPALDRAAVVIASEVQTVLAQYLSDLRAQVTAELSAILQPIDALQGQGIGGRPLSALVRERAWLAQSILAALARAHAPDWTPTVGVALADGRLVPFDSSEGRARTQELASKVASRSQPMRAPVGLANG